MESRIPHFIDTQSALARFERAAEKVLRELATELQSAEEERPGFGWVDNDTAMGLLGLSRPTLARYRADGTLPYAKLGSSVYYKVSDIEAVLESRAVVRETS